MARPRSSAHLAWGLAVRGIRNERGLSQERLAQLADLDRTYVSGVERGERNPSLTTFLRLATALEIQVSEIATRAETILAE
jgi:transcriptional regulator with XRE-family HTH domain